MSDTPRTDDCGVRALSRPVEYRWQSFEDCARQLERELATAREQIKCLNTLARSLNKGDAYWDNFYKKSQAHITERDRQCAENPLLMIFH